MVKTGIRKTSRPIFKLCQTFLFSNFKNKRNYLFHCWNINLLRKKWASYFRPNKFISVLLVQ